MPWSRVIVPELGLTDDFSAVVDGGIEAETGQALRHVERILAACDATPARIAAGCASLLFGARIELDCIAYRP